jgi:hypothetical protein
LLVDRGSTSGPTPHFLQGSFIMNVGVRAPSPPALQLGRIRFVTAVDRIVPPASSFPSPLCQMHALHVRYAMSLHMAGQTQTASGFDWWIRLVDSTPGLGSFFSVFFFFLGWNAVCTNPPDFLPHLRLRPWDLIWIVIRFPTPGISSDNGETGRRSFCRGHSWSMVLHLDEHPWCFLKSRRIFRRNS